MSEERRVIDASALPKVPFDHHSLVWWGTLAFMVIEGFTLLLMAASYFYLRTGVYEWPPGRTPDPALLWPTLNTLLLLAIILPLRAADRAARRADRRGVLRGLVLGTALTVPALALRWLELVSLHVRHDAHAYASAAWGVVLLHATLLVVDLFETGTLAALFLLGRAERKHYSDVSDAALYQYFLSLSWVPLYLIVYWGPRLL